MLQNTLLIKKVVIKFEKAAEADKVIVEGMMG
jgi:hypothetical protein